jgi:hypothetical protein
MIGGSSRCGLRLSTLGRKHDQGGFAAGGEAPMPRAQASPGASRRALSSDNCRNGSQADIIVTCSGRRGILSAPSARPRWFSDLRPGTSMRRVGSASRYDRRLLVPTPHRHRAAATQTRRRLAAAPAARVMRVRYLQGQSTVCGVVHGDIDGRVDAVKNSKGRQNPRRNRIRTKPSAYARTGGCCD